MLKVLKEIIIYILIIALIALVLGILFYDKLPTNKIVPAKVEYTLPENLQGELDKTLAEEEEKEVLVTYAVDESDLNGYQSTKQYNPGKVDPFAEYTEEVTNEQSTAGTNNSLSTGNSGGGQLTETKPGK